MNAHWLTVALAPLVLSAGEELVTSYEGGKTVRIVSETSYLMEMVDFEMLVDGEPVEGRGNRGGSSTEETRRVEQVDTWLEAKDGELVKLKRSFDVVEAAGVRVMGENERETERAAPLSGVTLLLERGDGGLEVEVVEGDEPTDGALLEGHEPELALDALLPEGEVAADATWDVDQDAILQALGLHLEDTMFPPPVREEGEGGEGRRGGRGGPGGGRSPFAPFRELDWTGKATLESANEEWEGHACAKIALEFQGDGQMESRMGRGGGRRGGRALELSRPLDTTYSVELTGALYYSLDAKLPIGLVLEGDITSDRNDEFTRGESTRTMIMLQEGELTHTVRVQVETTDEGSK